MYVYTDTSTSFIFRLQPFMLFDESHSRFIFPKINSCFFGIAVDISVEAKSLINFKDNKPIRLKN